MTALITKGQQNKQIHTLSELASDELENNWLFVYRSDSGKETVKSFLTDSSAHVDRYNEFIFTEGTDITFNELGAYLLKVYQMPDQDDTDETRGLLVEVSRVQVISASETEFKQYNTNTNAKAYKKQ